MEHNKKKGHVHTQLAEMQFMRYTKGCPKADKIRNETIRSYLNIFSINDEIENKTKLKGHVDRMIRK